MADDDARPRPPQTFTELAAFWTKHGREYRPWDPGPLDQAKLTQLDDARVVEDVYERVVGLISGSEGRTLRRQLDRFPVGARLLYATQWVHEEICNGGFLQYIWNDNAHFDELAIEGFRFCGAAERAALFEQALEHFREHFAELTPHLEKGGVEDFAAAEKLGIFESLQQRYFACTEDLDQLWLRTIRATPSAFVPL